MTMTGTSSHMTGFSSGEHVPGAAVVVTSDLPAGGPFLTVAEVALMMRVSNMTVYRLIRIGELPALRISRSFRIPESAVTGYLKGAAVFAPGAAVGGRGGGE